MRRSTPRLDTSTSLQGRTSLPSKGCEVLDLKGSEVEGRSMQWDWRGSELLEMELESEVRDGKEWADMQV